MEKTIKLSKVLKFTMDLVIYEEQGNIRIRVASSEPQECKLLFMHCNSGLASADEGTFDTKIVYLLQMHGFTTIIIRTSEL